MSSHRRRLTLKPQARADIKDALLHTQEQWDNEQRGRYKAAIDRVLRELIDYPALGRARDELSPD